MIKKKIVRKKMGGISEMGFRDDSPYRDREFIDINTPDGTIDMSNTGIPLYAEDETGYGQYLPPHSGIHQFRGKRVRERRLQKGGKNKKYIDSTLNANKHLDWVQRLYEQNALSLQIPGQGAASTHFMESSDGLVYPKVVRENGQLKVPYDARRYADSTHTGIQFPTDADAKWFGENYKKGTGVLRKFQRGGKLPKAQLGLPPLDKPKRDNTRVNRELLTPKEQSDLAMRNQIAQNATVMTQGKVQTAAQIATEKAKKQAYTVSNPNAQLDPNGNLTTKNPYRTLEGTPIKGTRAWYNAQGLNTALDAGLVAADLQGTGALVRAGVKGVVKEGAEQINSKILSSSSGMDAVYAKQPGYNSHLFKKQGYVPPTTDPNLMAQAPQSIAQNMKFADTHINETLGMLKPGKQKAIDRGNQWINDWVSHPTTQKKVADEFDSRLAANALWGEKQGLPTTAYDEVLMQAKNRALNYKGNSQMVPIEDHISRIVRGKRNMHQGNAGIAYGHHNPGAPALISRNPFMSNKGREQVTVHENAHQWVTSDMIDVGTSQYDDIMWSLSDDALNSYYKADGKTYNGIEIPKEKMTAYLATPTEVHARIMEMRKHFNLTPDNVITPEGAQIMMDAVRAGKTPIDTAFPDVIRDNRSAANLFNKLFTVAPVAAAGSAAALSNNKRLGGNIYEEGGETDDLLELFDDDDLLSPATAPAAAPEEEQRKPKSTMEADLRRQREFDAAMEIVNEERLPYNERRGTRTSPINYGAAPSPSTGGAKGTKNANGQFAFNYLTQEKGLPAHWAAGIVGNYVQESGNFREDVINGTVTGDGGKAKGTAQWHPERWAKLVEYNKKLGQDPYTLKAQLDFTVHEATQRGDFEKMKAARNSAEAANIFAKWYERPKIIDNNRARYAQLYHP